MESLEEIRQNIDRIDSMLARLFELRMQESRKAAEYKLSHNMAVRDRAREQKLINANCEKVSSEALKSYYMLFEQNLIDISSSYQQNIIDANTDK